MLRQVRADDSRGAARRANEGGFWQTRVLADLHDVRRLGTLGTLGDFEFHFVVLIQGTETGSLDGREVNENVGAIGPSDETETLALVEPLYTTAFSHLKLFPSCTTPGPALRYLAATSVPDDLNWSPHVRPGDRGKLP